MQNKLLKDISFEDRLRMEFTIAWIKAITEDPSCSDAYEDIVVYADELGREQTRLFLLSNTAIEDAKYSE